MDISELRKFSIEVVNSMPWLKGIESHQQYEQLINFMGELVEDYDRNQLLIELLFPVIERYEEDSEHFLEFNKHMASIDQGVAMLHVLMEQHGLTLSDLPEIGDKSLLSQILEGERSLTVTHIRALSDRFGIPQHMFLES